MQITFKKKTPTDEDRTYNIDEGSTIIENYNETLDSANIRISHQTERLNIEPFDKVVLRDEGRLGYRFMCVDTYTETMESLDPITYSYEISLFSETKELENYVLPNLSITQLKDGTHRSVKYYLEQYLNLYGPKIRVNGVFIKKFAYIQNGDDPRFTAKFNIDCPEMQWNNPTLREVITDLMMVVDCIPIKRNDSIDFLDLTKKKDPIDTSKVNYIQRSQSAEDYVSELRMDMLNVMQTSIDKIKNSCETTEYLTFKASDDGYVVTDENMILQTQFPILNIKHLWMIYAASIDGDKFFVTVDLCNLHSYVQDKNINLVYEFEEFSTLPKRRFEPTGFAEVNQNIALYYTRGSNVLTGFSTLSKKRWWGYGSSNSTLNILKNLINADRGGYDAYFSLGNLWFSTFFKIEYETTTDSVFQAGKMLPTTHDRIVTDNQTNAYVDAYNQGFMEYQKANRLGNQQLHINARYENDFSSLIEIGDFYEDSIVFQTQYQIYKNHIEVNALATKDYILRDYFTGVKARVRSWKIADASQALTRHDLNKYYLEFSFSNKDELIDVNLTHIDTYDFLSPFYDYYIEPIKYCCFYTKDENNEEYPAGVGARYSIDTIGRIIGNSIVYNFGFEDNIIVSKSVSGELTANDIDNTRAQPNTNSGTWSIMPFKLSTSFTGKYGGVPLEPTRYANNNGEFNIISYNLITSIEQSSNMRNFENWSDNDEDNFMLDTCGRPLVNTSNFNGSYYVTDTKIINKDNREITKLSTQFEFCTDTTNIMFTKKFLEYQKCIRNEGRIRNAYVDYVPDTWSLDSESGYYFSTSIILKETVHNGTLYSQSITGGTIVDVQIVEAGSHLVILVIIDTNDINNVSVTLTFVYQYEDLHFTKNLKIYRLPASQYDFRNTNPDINGLTPMTTEISVTRFNYNTTELYFSVPGVPGTTNDVPDSAFYIYDGDNLLLMVKGKRRLYLNLLKSRDYNIYDNYNVPIDTIY